MTKTFLTLALLSAASLSAQTAKKPAETEAQLEAQAKISEAVAAKSAVALVPGGKVKTHELEKENGKLVWSFDIATKGKSGIDEVQIDAITGAQVGKVVHESPKNEKAEAAAEKKEAAAAKKKP
jgi:uncharacterized membrane protein YkoI